MSGGALAGIGFAGSAANAYGQVQSAKATSNAANFNANVAAQNAIIATQKQQWVGEEGDQEASISQMKTAAKVGSIKANQGASGVDVGTGSHADVVTSAREVGMLDALTIRSNAARAAYGYATEAYSDKAQEALDRYAGKNAITAGNIGATSTILGGAAQSSQYSDYTSSNSIM